MNDGLPISIVQPRQEIILDDADEQPRRNASMQPKDYVELIPADELKCSLQEKRRYTCDNVRFLNYDDCVELGLIIKESHPKLLKENSDGIRTDLDQIKDEKVINKIYAAVKHKISQRK